MGVIEGLPARVVQGLAELIFPTICAGCGGPGSVLCDACIEVMPRIDPGGACPRCGAPEGSVRCAECGGREFAFSAARCYGLLDGPLSRSVVIFKDSGELRLKGPLGGMLAETAGEWAAWAEALVPLPASPAALRRRGFDHAAVLAEELSRRCGLPVLRLLRRGRSLDQRGLSRERRLQNLAGALSVVGPYVPQNVLLLDDVITTGATLDAAASRLMSVGAAEVRAVALARKCGVCQRR